MTNSSCCPLCFSENIQAFYEDKYRCYFECLCCALIHVPKEFHLSIEAEKSEYDLHQNDSNDLGYRSFLNKVAEPLTKLLPIDSRGLDFGCGPGPTLSLMLIEHGFDVDNYDPIYFPNTDLRAINQYDFLVSTEVVEHLRQPSETLQKMWGLIKEGGLLAVMTKQALSVREFSAWHYKNDPTHICFWRSETFSWLAEAFFGEIVFQNNEVVILKK